MEVWGFVHSIIVLPPGEKHFWGLEPNNGIDFTGCEIAAYVFLALLITLQLDLIAARSSQPFFIFSTTRDDAGHYVGIPPPSLQVLGTLAISLTIGTLIAILWEEDITLGSGYGMDGIGWRNGGLVWCWGILWFIIIDLAKFFVISICDILADEEKRGGISWTVFFKSVLELPWNKERNDAAKRTEIDRLRDGLRSHIDADNVSSIRSNGMSMSIPFSIGLASLAQELATEGGTKDQISFQDALLAVETLQNDPQLLRVIASMYYKVHQLEKRVQELEGKKEK